MDALSISGHALTMTPRLTCHAMRSWLGACRVHELLTRDENQRKKIHFEKMARFPEAPLGELCPLGFLARPARRAATRSLFSGTWGFAAALRKTYQNWQPCPELSTAVIRVCRGLRHIRHFRPGKWMRCPSQVTH